MTPGFVPFVAQHNPNAPRVRCTAAILRPIRCAAILLAFLIGGAFAHVGDANAQAGDQNYYTSAGTELLHNVEAYHLQLAEEKLRARQYESAWGDINFMLRFFPNHPQALLLMSQLCLAWHSPHCQIEDTFVNAVVTDPTRAPTYIIYGIYLMRSGKTKNAVEAFGKALEIDPDSFNAHYNVGLAYVDLKQYDLANQHAQRAYALGAPFPGLRDKLMKVGKWKPLSPSAKAASDAAATAPKASDPAATAPKKASDAAVTAPKAATDAPPSTSDSASRVPLSK